MNFNEQIFVQQLTQENKMPSRYTVNLIKTVKIDVTYCNISADSLEDARIIASTEFDNNFESNFKEMDTYPDGVVESIQSDYGWHVVLEKEPVAPPALTQADIKTFEEAENGYVWYGARVGPILLATGSGCVQDAKSLAEIWFSDPQAYISLNENNQPLLAQAIAIAKTMVVGQTVIVVLNQ